jgi:outer membrane protein assembly factor BamC
LPLCLATTALIAALTGCSTLSDITGGDKVDYRSGAIKAPSLDVPPDLTQLSRDARYVVPGAAVTSSAYQVGQAAPVAAVTAVPSVGDVQVMRAGNQRWLLVKRPADKLWEPVRDFWRNSGFELAIEQQNLGIIETEYAENRAKLPQDLIRNLIGKLVDRLYSTGERDKFRTRLETTPEGYTEIFVSHRGMIETVAGAVGNGQIVWQPRPADPELEAEFLRRLMLKLGVPAEQANAMASNDVKPGARLATVQDVPVVQIDDGFERAWRRVGLSLDRTGFTVEDRDRAQGLYFVRYVEPNADKKDTGFFSKLFSSTPSNAPLKYQIAVRSQGQSTTVSVLSASGAPEASATTKRILQVIVDDLK